MVSETQINGNKMVSKNKNILRYETAKHAYRLVINLNL